MNINNHIPESNNVNESSGNKKIKVLASMSGDYVFGGVEAYLEGLYPHLCEVNVAMDVFVPGKVSPEKYEVLQHYGIRAIECGHEVIEYKTGSQRLRLYKKVSRELYGLLNSTKYDVIHVNTGVPLASAAILGTAQRCGIHTRIAHSHSYDDFELFSGGSIKAIYRRLLRRNINLSSTIKIACSEMAGEYLFGAKIWHKEGVLLQNGIDSKNYVYSASLRNESRAIANTGIDAPVFCHVGRFDHEKNHEFLIDVFSEILSVRSDAVLWLIGNGPLYDTVIEKVAKLGISNSVRFLGSKSDVGKYLSGADVFIFPSLHEGFGIALIEAECSGMPCICSDGVPNKACLKDCDVTVLPLSSGSSAWAYSAISALSRERKTGCEKKVITAGFDISETNAQILTFYVRSAQSTACYYRC